MACIKHREVISSSHAPSIPKHLYPLYLSAGSSPEPLPMQQQGWNTERRRRRQSRLAMRHNKVDFIRAADMQPDSAVNHISQAANHGVQHLATVIHNSHGLPKADSNVDNNPHFVETFHKRLQDSASYGTPETTSRLSSASDSGEDEVVFSGRVSRDRLRTKRSRYRIGNPFTVDSGGVNHKYKETSSSFHHHQTCSESKSPQVRSPRPVAKHKARWAKSNKGHLSMPPTDGTDLKADYIEHIKDERNVDALSVQFSATFINSSPGEAENPRSSPRSWDCGDPDNMISDPLPSELSHIISETEEEAGFDHLFVNDHPRFQGGVEISPERPISRTADKQVKPREDDEDSSRSFLSSTRRSDSILAQSVEQQGEDQFHGRVAEPIAELILPNLTDAEHSSRSVKVPKRPGLYSDNATSTDTLMNLNFFQVSESGKIENPLKDMSEDEKSATEEGSLSKSAVIDASRRNPCRDFDLMGFSRSSLRGRRKGKHHVPEFKVSDSELELDLERAWNNNRTKKKAKKQQRAELRSRGLLGRMGSQPNLKVKYSDGITIDELRLEVESFLLSPFDSLCLPPMNKEDRKIVHNLANALSLKSQSKGNGLSRFAIIYKTSRTSRFTERNIARVEEVFSEHFDDQLGNFSDGKSGNRRNKTKRKRQNAAVSYMDGDIVGASAPEIGADNKGRAMLEKMGWSTGTGLGARDNKGILQPVTHVVKNSRAGLG